MLQVLGSLFIIIVGSLLHFLFEWSNNNKIVGFFAAVNESTWEHIKLAITPSFLWLIVEGHFYFSNPNLFFAKFISMLVMIIIIPVIFYTYTFFTKKNYLVMDIGIFVIAVVVGQLLFYLLLNCCIINNYLNHIGILGLILIFFKYITRTYVPKNNFLFKDPITNTYGIKCNK